MTNVADWVGESSATVGTGDLTLGGALPGYSGFFASASGEVWYTIADGDNRESGIGTFDALTFFRDTVHTTLVGGVYNDSGPQKIFLSGNAQIFCTFSKTAYEEFRDHLHSGVYEPADAALQAHLVNVSNPHSVTINQIGAEPVNSNIQDHISDADPHLTADERGALDNSPTLATAANPIATQADIVAQVGLIVTYHETAAEALSASQGDGGAGLHVAPEGT